MPKQTTTKIKGFIYLPIPGVTGRDKVTLDKAGWQQLLSNYKDVRIEKLEQVTSYPDDAVEPITNGKFDYIISARGTKDKDWGQRNLIAEAYGVHPIKGA